MAARPGCACPCEVTGRHSPFVVVSEFEVARAFCPCNFVAKMAMAPQTEIQPSAGESSPGEIGGCILLRSWSFASLVSSVSRGRGEWAAIKGR